MSGSDPAVSERVTSGVVFGSGRVYGGPMVSGDVPPNSRDDASTTLDPARIQTLPELAAALKGLAGSRSYTGLDRAVRGQSKVPVLPPSTLSDLFNGRSVPTRGTLVKVLTACGVLGPDQQRWLAAWERVGAAHLRQPAGAVRVREADPRRLGVHASIQVDPGVDDLPVYVPRDVDADLRTAIAAAKDRGGFVLVKGGSSVGKTRALVEMVKAVLPDWWLLHPPDAASVRGFADAPTPRTLLWLDELQRYLNQPGGVPVGTVRALLAAGVMIAGTLWPHEYAVRTALRVPGQDDQYAEDRELLGLARVIEVQELFSPGERSRAEKLAGDRRIRTALDAADAGLTQVLAAGPELIRWWEHADGVRPPQCYGKAVITAALDARRVGATTPLTREFLTMAAPAYLSSAQQATAKPDWFEQAIDYATTSLHGAAACLTPVAAGMGEITGWVTADYLHQHALKARRTEPVPDQVWQALTAHHHPADAARLAEHAYNRGRILDKSFYSRPAVAAFVAKLVDLLVDQSRIDEAIAVLRSPADTGDWFAAVRLAHMLADHGHVTELRQRARAGDMPAASRLAAMLAQQDRLEELRQRADADDRYAVARLIELLIDQGRIDEVAALLRPCADAGDGFAALRLAKLLLGQGRIDEVAALLRPHADANDRTAAAYLAELLAEHGRTDELRARADAGDGFAVACLAKLLADQGRVDELRARADAGEGFAAGCLAELLAGNGQMDQAAAALEPHADAGDRSAAVRLAGLLAGQGRADELRQRADRGDRPAAVRLAELFVDRGRIDEAVTVLRSLNETKTYAAARLTGLLAGLGRVDELRQRAAAGDWSAIAQLAHLLAEQGRVEELQQRAGTGDAYATGRLIELLGDRGQVDELRKRADASDESAARWLAHLLAEQGNLDELRQRADAGDRFAAFGLAELLVDRGQVDEAIAVLRQRADAGDKFAAFGLAELLVDRGQVDEAIAVLRQRADAGDESAASRLVKLLVDQGRIPELEAEVRAGVPGALAHLTQMRRKRKRRR